jgi:hypothetical protein
MSGWNRGIQASVGDRTGIESSSVSLAGCSINARKPDDMVRKFLFDFRVPLREEMVTVGARDTEVSHSPKHRLSGAHQQV